MGTQQILLIVLSVIIVGIAAAVGLQMFTTQAQTMNRKALSNDLQNFGAHAIAFYKTPASLGGGGNGNPGYTELQDIAISLGFQSNGTYTNANGTYEITSNDANGLVITATGTELGANQASGNVKVVLTVDADNNDVPRQFLSMDIQN